jgi:hypothetical protein
MRKLVVRLLIAGLLACMLVPYVYEFRANDTAGYYRAHPERLLYAVIVAAIGGVVLHGFHRFASRAQPRRWQFSLATLFLVMTAIAWVFALIWVIAM